MTESVWFEGAEEAAADKPRFSRRTLAIAAGGGVVVLLGGFLVLHHGSSSSDNSSFIAPRHVVKAAQTGSSTTAKKAAPLAIPATFTDVVGRDPFKPLIVAQQAAAATGTSAPTAGAPQATPASTSPTGPTSSTTTQGVRIALIHVFSKSGTQYAQTKVGDTVYTPSVGSTFAGAFTLKSVAGSCATYLNGSSQFQLCEGQEVLK